MCLRGASTGLVLLIFAGVSARAQPVQPLDGEAIAAIWKERQDKVKTAAFEMTMTDYYPQGGYGESNPMIFMELDRETQTLKKRPGEAGRGPIPKSDFRVTGPAKLLIDGVKVRYDYQSCQYDRAEKQLYVRSEQSAFDGTYFREVIGRKTGDEGAVGQYPAYRDAGFVGVSTVFTAFRGRSKGMTRCDAPDLIPTGRRTTIDGYECQEYLAYKKLDTGATRHVWLSPNQGWNIVRDLSHNPQSGTVDQKEARYKADSEVGWVPVMWSFSRTTKGALRMSQRFDVVSYSINTPIQPSEFMLQFSTGMQVFHEDPPGGVVGKIQADGRLLPDDGRAAYFLPGTGEPRWRRLLRYAIYGLVALTVSLFAFRTIRRYRRKAIVVSSCVPPPSEGVSS